MPPKRKVQALADAEESPSKRITRASSAHALKDAQPARRVPAQPLSLPQTPCRAIKTYKSLSARKRDGQAAEANDGDESSLKEYRKRRQISPDQSESEEFDELNMLSEMESPHIPEHKHTNTLTAHIDSITSPRKRGRPPRNHKLFAAPGVTHQSADDRSPSETMVTVPQLEVSASPSRRGRPTECDTSSSPSRVTRLDAGNDDPEKRASHLSQAAPVTTPRKRGRPPKQESLSPPSDGKRRSARVVTPVRADANACSPSRRSGLRSNGPVSLVEVMRGKGSSSKPTAVPTLPSKQARSATPQEAVSDSEADSPALPQFVDLASVRGPRHPDASPSGESAPSTPASSSGEDIDALTPQTPSKSCLSNIVAPTVTPLSPSRLPRVLPTHLHHCVTAQKRAVLAALQNPPNFPPGELEDEEQEEKSTNALALSQLEDLLNATVTRGEGNSCLLLGPKGSGKSRLVDQCIAKLESPSIVIRLSGWAQLNDRSALREIARQVAKQTGNAFLTVDNDEVMEGEGVPAAEEDADANPFLDANPTPSVPLPPPSHLHALISLLPTLPRPTILVLDGFDLFAEHPRQALLYCLLDTVQSCRVSKDRKGIAVIGVTTRVDTVTMLEKRVKSRFSGRILRTAGPHRFEDWMAITRSMLMPSVESPDGADWQPLWTMATEKFLNDSVVSSALKETYCLSRDVKVLSRLLTPVVLELDTASPFLIFSKFPASILAQRTRPSFSSIHALPYPSICLLVAAMHSQTSGHDVMTFEQLFQSFRDQVRSSSSAPVQLGGSGIGMMNCSREILLGSFETLVAARYFVSIAPASASLAAQFVKYRCAVDYDTVKHAVERMGRTDVKKWLKKL